MRLQDLCSSENAAKPGLERLNHDEHNDRDQRQGGQLVDQTEKPRRVAILVRRELAAPAGEYNVKNRQCTNKSELSPNPTHLQVDHPRYYYE